jgi:glycosyltransferase involved in cell wall biosynthesis
MYSVVILTLNEELALPACLAAVRGCDDIVVLDSGSTDSTAALATAAGARVFVRPFDTFAGQRNHALRNIPFRNPWVLNLDADERMTPELDEECRTACARQDLDGFRIAPKMMFQGRWVRHCTDYPAYQARLVRLPGFEFIQVGHGQRESPAMRMENLRSSYLHDMSVYGEDSWLQKHKGYARAEAERVLFEDAIVARPWKDLTARDPLSRRRALKRISFMLPFRAASRFVYQYFLRLGFLDGSQGLRYCVLLARYEGFIAEQIAIMRERDKVSHPSEP